MSDVAAYHVLVCALFPVQGGMWTVHVPPCTRNNTWYAAISPIIMKYS